MNSEWLFLGNYDAEYKAENVKTTHLNCYIMDYPKMEYKIDKTQAMFQTRYLLYVNLHDKK